jgi:hypothetical protein
MNLEEPLNSSTPGSTQPREVGTQPSEWFVGTLMILIWVGLMIHLLLTQVMPQRSEAALVANTQEPADLIRQWKDLEEYSVIRNSGKIVGSALSRVTREENRSGFRADFRLGLGLNLLGRYRDIIILGAAELNSLFHLNRFHVTFLASPIKVRATGLVSGSDFYVEVDQGIGGEPVRRRIVLDRPISLMEAVVPAAIRAMDVRPGAQFAFPVVDPLWSFEHGVVGMRVGDQVTIQLGQKSHLAYPVEVSLRDFRTRLYVSPEGKVLRHQLIGSYTLDASSKEEASLHAEVLQRKVPIPELRASDFSGVEPSSFRGLAPSKSTQTPLGLLQGLAP